MQYEIDTDSIGNVVCKKAEELDAAVTVLARHRCGLQGLRDATCVWGY
jgi:hypothetical protein